MGTLRIVDFWAQWCEPCKKLTPLLDTVIEEYKNEYGDRIQFEKINVEDDEQMAVTYEVRGVPTVLCIKDDTIVARIVGLKPIQEYRRVITECLQ